MSAHGSETSDVRRMLPTTPTISGFESPMSMRCPIGDSPGNARSAAAWLMMTTGGPEASCASNSRPVRSGICSALEVAPRRHLPADLGPTLAGGDRPIDPLQRSGPRVARERRHLRSADGSNRRQGGDVGERARVERLSRLVLLIAPVGQGELHRQHAGGVEAGSTDNSLLKLTSVRPAHASSTTARAISAATRLDAARRAPGVIVPRRCPRAPARSVRRSPMHAMALNISADTTAAPTAKSSTDTSMSRCSRLGMNPVFGMSAASTGAAYHATATPANPPANASARPSVRT